MKWLEDAFYAFAFVVSVALVVFAVYDGSVHHPSPKSDGIVAADAADEPPGAEQTPKIVVTLAESYEASQPAN